MGLENVRLVDGLPLLYRGRLFSTSAALAKQTETVGLRDLDDVLVLRQCFLCGRGRVLSLEYVGRKPR